MASAAYIAIVERGKCGYGVFFPDLPGCLSAGLTEQEVFAGAEEALAGHLAEMLIERETLPRPSEEIALDPDVDEYCRILVRVELPGKALRLNITMDEGLVAAIDRIATNRSSSLADAACAALMRRREDHGA